MDLIKLILDIGVGLCAFKLAWSVDRTQKEMLKIQAQQATILAELSHRVERLELRIHD